MISSYELTLQSADGAFIPYECAYRLYSWLLSSLPEDAGDALHMQGTHPISQHLRSEREGGRAVWRVSLLNEAAHGLFSDVLECTETIGLHGGALTVTGRSHSPVIEAADLIRAGRSGDSSGAALLLHTPTAFKQAGRYTPFPQERLIVQSLVRSWSLFCPEYPLDDEDALQMLTEGLAITDYSLRSARYRLKNAAVPGFAGRLTLSPRLSAPMLELWNTLLGWAEYSGIGIKTTLGMGGVSVQRGTVRG